MSTGINVLHVDDESSIRELTATFLERENDQISVQTATSPDEGLRLLAESEIDCIVSDYQMPEMNGIEFLEVVTEHHPNIPFILYTGKGSEEVASEAISAGVTDYLQKETGTDDYTLLANRIVHAVDSQQREQRIKFLQTLENELTELSIDFLRAEERDVDTLIDRSLRKLGKLVDADRTYVFDLDPEVETLSNTHEWCSEDVEPQIDRLQDLPQDRFSWWMQKLKNFEEITVPNVSDLPAEAEAEQEILKEQNIESLIVTPMILNHELVGFIGFDWADEQEVWSDEFLNMLWTVSELITTAFKRRERETELRELTERFNLAIEGANLGVWDWNVQTDAVTFNQQWVEMLGLSLDEIEPTLDAWKQRVHPEDIEDVETALEAHFDGQTDYYDTEHRVRTASGEWKWIRDIGRVVERDDDAEPIRATGIHLDITEQKERQQELKEFETIIESLTDAVYVLDEEGKFTYINEEFVDLVGYTRERILGSDPSLIKNEVAVEQAEEKLGELLSSDGPRTVTFEVPIRPRTGDPVVCEDHMGVLPYDGETFDGSVGVLRDITDRNEFERALEAQNERLEEFASIVSHDLRSPLGVAEGRLELASATTESEHLAKAADAIERSQALIDDLLTLAREGEQVDETEPVDLAEVAESSWQTVETAQATLDACSQAIIKADRSRVQELFENLYRNAVEHGGENVTVSVKTIDDSFFVADSGPGISEGDHGRIFEAGYSTDDDGTGFGLRIVEQIAEAHGWTISVTESEQGGARFEVTGVDRVD